MSKQKDICPNKMFLAHNHIVRNTSVNNIIKKKVKPHDRIINKFYRNLFSDINFHCEKYCVCNLILNCNLEGYNFFLTITLFKFIANN